MYISIYRPLFLPSALVAIATLLSVLPPASATDYFISSWNVENLFDATDDPQTEDFKSPAWTAQKLDTKLTNLAKVVRDMNGGNGPDILGLCEIENEQVVKDLVTKVALTTRDYKIVHKDSADERGIDCAIVYDANVFTLDGKKFHELQLSGNKTRDIAEAKFKVGSDTLYVFMNHWPSKNNPPDNREAAGALARQKVDAILASSANADIVLLGDLNDNPDEPSVKSSLKAAASAQNLRDGEFYDSTYPIFQQAPNAGTYVFNNKWDLIDHVILSPGLLDNAGFKWKVGSTSTIKADYQLTTPTSGSIARPRITGSSNFDSGGYSDHLPVSCILQR